MSKFSGRGAVTRRPAGPITTTGPAVTHEGGAGHAYDIQSELFLLSVVNMVGEATFYESADQRDERFASLVRSNTQADPAWTGQLIGWLRSAGNMRSAPIVAACEYVAAGGPNGRAVIDAACQRADEPGEILGYWLAVHGRPIPKPIKRGLGDACRRLYTERNLLKYDTPSHGVRWGDVIELAHVRPRGQWQADLFRYAIERRHGRDDARPGAIHSVLLAAAELDQLPPERRREALRTRGARALGDAGYTWERLGGWLPGGMDAEAWEAIIPSMGYMALLRNLRNFEQAKISAEAERYVIATLTDPEQVARSRQFPFRFMTAFRELDKGGHFTYLKAIEQAGTLATANVPEFDGRTLVMIDTSSSMTSPLSRRSSVECVEVAAMFGAAVARRSDAEVWPYADRTYRTEVKGSIQGTVRQIRGEVGRVGHGTHTWPSVATAMDDAARRGKPFTRVCVFSDVQDHASGWDWATGRRKQQGEAPKGIPVYVWNLGGYATSNLDTKTAGHVMLGGFSDAAFKLVPLLERGRSTGWPWELEA